MAEADPLPRSRSSPPRSGSVLRSRSSAACSLGGRISARLLFSSRGSRRAITAPGWSDLRVAITRYARAILPTAGNAIVRANISDTVRFDRIDRSNIGSASFGVVGPKRDSSGRLDAARTSFRRRHLVHHVGFGPTRHRAAAGGPGRRSALRRPGDADMVQPAQNARASGEQRLPSLLPVGGLDVRQQPV